MQQALLLTPDRNVWLQQLDADKREIDQALFLINRRTGLQSLTLDDHSRLYYGSTLPTLEPNAIATDLASGKISIYGKAVLVTDAPESWVIRALESLGVAPIAT